MAHIIANIVTFFIKAVMETTVLGMLAVKVKDTEGTEVRQYLLSRKPTRHEVHALDLAKFNII